MRWMFSLRLIEPQVLSTFLILHRGFEPALPAELRQIPAPLQSHLLARQRPQRDAISSLISACTAMPTHSLLASPKGARWLHNVDDLGLGYSQRFQSAMIGFPIFCARKRFSEHSTSRPQVRRKI